jgi:hypothetical protein
LKLIVASNGKEEVKKKSNMTFLKRKKEKINNKKISLSSATIYL